MFEVGVRSGVVAGVVSLERVIVEDNLFDKL